MSLITVLLFAGIHHHQCLEDKNVTAGQSVPVFLVNKEASPMCVVFDVMISDVLAAY